LFDIERKLLSLKLDFASRRSCYCVAQTESAGQCVLRHMTVSGFNNARQMPALTVMVTGHYLAFSFKAQHT